MLGRIIPIDIFFRGVGLKPPTSQSSAIPLLLRDVHFASSGWTLGIRNYPSDSPGGYIYI